MIRIENISKEFQPNFWEKSFLALDDVSFSINQGDLVGFLGANGAGKTTLIKILMDFSRATRGSVHFDPTLGKDFLDAKNKIGYLPEKAYLYPHLTGMEFLSHIADLHEIKKSEAKKIILEHAEKLNLTHALDKKIKVYSKGMQQRLGFISCIMHKPSFVILDEPLSGLDPIGRREFKKIFKELNQEGVTVFFSSHVVSDVEEICNKVVFLEKGKLVYDGSIDELIHSNSSNLYQVTYQTGSEIKIHHAEKTSLNQFLSTTISSGGMILNVQNESPTLEEIIYKIKRQNNE